VTATGSLKTAELVTVMAAARWSGNELRPENVTRVVGVEVMEVRKVMEVMEVMEARCDG
jgi:hypothetical protein